MIDSVGLFAAAGVEPRPPTLTRFAGVAVALAGVFVVRLSGRDKPGDADAAQDTARLELEPALPPEDGALDALAADTLTLSFCDDGGDAMRVSAEKNRAARAQSTAPAE